MPFIILCVCRQGWWHPLQNTQDGDEGLLETATKAAVAATLQEAEEKAQDEASERSQPGTPAWLHEAENNLDRGRAATPERMRGGNTPSRAVSSEFLHSAPAAAALVKQVASRIEGIAEQPETERETPPPLIDRPEVLPAPEAAPEAEPSLPDSDDKEPKADEAPPPASEE